METENRHAVYEHDKLPAAITRPLYVMYGVGRYNQGQIEIEQSDYAGSDGFQRVLLSTTEITVAIPPEQNIKGKLLKVLEDEKAAVQAEYHQKVKAVQDKIDNLLAIEYRVEGL